jgi:hypothetical protein
MLIYFNTYFIQYSTCCVGHCITPEFDITQRYGNNKHNFILFLVLYFLIFFIFVLFEWLCWMVTSLYALGLELITPKYMYFNVC